MFFDVNQEKKVKALTQTLERLYPQWVELVHHVNTEWKAWAEKDLYKGSWDVHGFIWNEQWIAAGQKEQILKQDLMAWVPFVKNMGFSKMGPKMSILPHEGYTDEVLRLHLGVTIPTSHALECGIQVGEEIRGWKEKEWLFFNDRIKHSAWNHTDRERVVLLVDIKKEGLAL